MTSATKPVRPVSRVPIGKAPVGHAPSFKAPATAVDPLLLMSRFTFGLETTTHADIVRYGTSGWWARQIAYGKGAGAGYAGHAGVAAQAIMLHKTPAQVRAWLKANGNEYGWDMMDQLTRVTLGLQTYSHGQVYESVVDFFANHLNVANHSDGVWTCRHTMDRDVIRKHAFASFTDMLLASAKNPAMLQYLNLADSTASAVNENYGRELMELHTVGTAAGYSESDVQNSAKILTGRTTDDDFNYVYQADRHWVGPITVMGFHHANATAAGGEAAADAFLRYLAAHPSTATHLATKLCIRYVSDSPSPSLVANVAKAYTDSGTQIVPMLEAIVGSAEFAASHGCKIRRPLENLIATVRVLGNGPGDLSKSLANLNWMAMGIGQVPLNWSAPNGYPDVAAAWRSSGTLLQLWEYHRGFAQNWWDGFAKIDTTKLYGATKPKTSGQAIALLCVRLTGKAFPPEHLAALQDFLNEPASTPMDKSNLQWYRDHLIPLILDSPAHALR